VTTLVANHTEPLPLVLDWDGTVTERDTLHMAIERFGDLEVFHGLEDELGRALTLDEVIAAEMATIRAPREDVVGFLLEHVRVRPGFRELVAEHDPLIVSAGFHELIDPVLRREGIEVRLVANHVHAAPEGWRATFPEGPICPVCSERCCGASGISACRCARLPAGGPALRGTSRGSTCASAVPATSFRQRPCRTARWR